MHVPNNQLLRGWGPLLVHHKRVDVSIGRGALSPGRDWKKSYQFPTSGQRSRVNVRSRKSAREDRAMVPYSRLFGTISIDFLTPSGIPFPVNYESYSWETEHRWPIEVRKLLFSWAEFGHELICSCGHHLITCFYFAESRPTETLSFGIFLSAKKKQSLICSEGIEIEISTKTRNGRCFDAPRALTQPTFSVILLAGALALFNTART